MTHMLEARDLSFAYNNDPVLKDVSFSIEKGDFATLIGSNGAGKSTLIKLLLGELLPTRGSLSLFETPLSSFRDFYKIGYVPQNGLFAHKDFPASVFELVSLNLYNRTRRFLPLSRELKEEVRNALRLVGMEAFEKRLVSELSGGQQQRILIARALVHHPELLILDEPTTGVDKETVMSFLTLLARLNKEEKLTILMVTHDISPAIPFLNRTFCLEEGSLVEIARDQILKELHVKHKHPHDSEDCCHA